MIKITSLTSERREGKATLTYDDESGARTEEIRISFLKPTGALLNGIDDIAERYKALAEKGEEADKSIVIEQLLHVDIQSPDIENEDGTVHRITESDLRALDVLQLRQLWEGVNSHFFLQMPATPQSSNTNSSSEPAAS
jgi:hypothetical protein